MRIRWDPKGQRFPAFHGRYIVYADRGQLRVRSWPRKRGPSKSKAVRLQNAWFKDANKLAKHCAAAQQVAAIAMTKGTGLYPRDLLLKCMSGGIIAPVTADGRVLEYRRQRVDPVDFQGFFMRLTADQNIGAAGENTPDWPLPLRDTSGFWSVVSPKIITIPAGVTMMMLFAGCQSVGTVTGQMMAGITGGTVARDGRQDTGLTAERGNQVFAGPLPVVAGETYYPVFYLQTNGVVSGNGSTFFGGIVLEAS